MTAPSPHPYSTAPDADSAPRAADRQPSEQSVGELIGTVTQDLSTLMRQEVELAKAEIKTEVAKVLASVFGRRLIRLQCYEGIDTHQALYEWDYARQMLAIRALSERQVDDDAADRGPQVRVLMRVEVPDLQASGPDHGQLGGELAAHIRRVDPAERGQVVDYLEKAPIVLAARSYDTDRLDPDRSPSVPMTSTVVTAAHLPRVRAAWPRCGQAPARPWDPGPRP